MVAVVAIVLSVAVDLVGGESMRNMSVLRRTTYADVVAAVRVVVVSVVPKVEASAVDAVLTVVVVVLVVVGYCSFCRSFL